MEQTKGTFSLCGLGQKAGFYSKTAFINVFRKETGKKLNEFFIEMKGLRQPAELIEEKA